MNKEILYAIGGLVIGLVIMLVIQNSNRPYDNQKQREIGESKMHEEMREENGSMHNMMGMMSGQLKGKTGDEFDKAFLAEMIVHHEGAVTMAELAKTNAKHQEIKDMANAIISAQTTEIKQMKEWQKTWYGQ